MITGNKVRGKAANIGGGLYLLNVLSVMITDNSFEENTADKGGGVYLSIGAGDFRNN